MFRFINSFRQDEKGAGFVEFTIAAPFMAILALGFVDCAGLFSAYSSMNRLANNGVELASTAQQLEEGAFSMGLDGTNCSGVSSAPASGSHHKLQSKVVGLATEAFEDKDLNVLENSFCVQSDYSSLAAATASGNPSDGEVVKLTLTATYKSVFPVVNGWKLKVEGQGPYLTSTNPV